MPVPALLPALQHQLPVLAELEGGALLQLLVLGVPHVAQLPVLAEGAPDGKQ